jgi:hypothetical protein
MTQADSVHSTPPTNTSALPVDPTRRRFLTVAAVGSMVGAGTLAAAALTPSVVPKAVASVGSSPALRVAIVRLAKAHEALIGAQAINEEAEAIFEDWWAQNPKPSSKRAIRKWIKMTGAYHDLVAAPSWQAMITAETAFAEAQEAVANVPITGAGDVQALAASSVIYNEVELNRHNRAPIARVVAQEYFRLGKGGAIMKAPFLKIVAGTDVPPATPTAETTTSQPPRKRKKRGAYQGERQPIEYQDGVPVIAPDGEEDQIFRRIADHRDAAAHYDRCVNVEIEAEDKVSAVELSHLQANRHNAFERMMLFARAVILCRPTTRRGLIHQARYLASQFTDPDGCNSGGWSLPDKIGEDPWQLAFLRSLAAVLRKMAGELDPQDEGGAA